MTTDNFRRSFFRSNTDETAPKLVIIEHPDLAEPMRFVADTLDLVHQGETYKAMPELDIPLPTMREGEISQLQLIYSDIFNERIKVIRGTVGACDATVFSVMASDPDVVEGGPYYFKIRGSQKDENGLMAGNLSLDDDVLDEPAQEDCYTPSNFPGLFA